MECASPLTERSRPVAEERKVVSVLFCDLVGFTAASERLDPEDVDTMLSAYAEVARARIEAHGGVVEKFIGDAVVGVFGVPASHEDDPERAVRAGLRIVEAAEELEAIGGAPLRLRVGVNTGETLVRLGANAGVGERVLAGDAINTASRLQSVAPEMGVAVGLSTFEATSVVFEYEELDPARVKGKAEPVRVFHAKAARARFGTDLTRTHDSPFIGREIDLALLKGVFDKTVASNSVQLVTVVGEGIDPVKGGCGEEGIERCLRKSNVFEPPDVEANVVVTTNTPLRLLDHPRARIDSVNVQMAGCSTSVSLPVPQPTSRTREPSTSLPRATAASTSTAG